MGINVLERIAIAIEKQNQIEEKRNETLEKINKNLERIYGGMS